MKFWKKQETTFCAECQHAFKPYGHPTEFADYCPQHRAPKIALRDRKRLVLRWAEANWEQLEQQAKKWESACMVDYQANMASLNQIGKSAQQNVFGLDAMFGPRV